MNFMFRLALATAVLAVCAAPAPPRAQRGEATPPRISQPVAREMANEYRRLVDQYLGGDPDPAISAARTWQPASVEAVQDIQRWDRTTMRAAAMLETDAALARARESNRTAGRSRGDRRVIPPIAARLVLAIRWLDRADKVRPADQSQFRRRWQVAVGRLLLWNMFDGLADSILGDASLLFPSDPDVLLAYGTAREAIAMNFAIDLERPLSVSIGPDSSRRDRRFLQDDARKALTRAVTAAPGSAEARLRLAHVHIMQGADGRALSLLEELRAGRPPAPVAYLTALMLGGIRERRGEIPAAADLFLEARGLIPGAQGAYLVHAHALRAAGQPEAAAEMVRSMLSRGARVTDPWFLYRLGLDERLTRLDPLRVEVLQQAVSAPEAPRVDQEPYQSPQDSPASFPARRQESARVILDVLVTRSHRPLPGMTAADFQVRDNGVLQRVELLPAEPVPIDLRMLIDLGSRLTASRADHVKAAARAALAALRENDRAELLTFSNDVTLAAAMTTDRQKVDRAIDRIAPAGSSTVVDAAFTALTLPEAPERRTLVLVFSDGRDTGSWLSPAAVIKAAAASRVTVYGVVVPEPDVAARSPALHTGLLRKWLLADPASFRDTFLPVLIDDTGGERLQASGGADLAATFADVLSRFNQRYLLGYTPTDAPRRGWRSVEVQVKDRSLGIAARKGYER